MIIRKKALKIQERLGMNIGVAYGTSSRPVIKTVNDAIFVLNELYKVGFRALVLPPDLFLNINNTTELYKEYYGDLLRIKNIAKKFNIQLALRHPSLPAQPDQTLRLFSTIASVMDCRVFTITPNFYQRVPRHQAITLAVHKVNEIVTQIRVKAKIGIETTGRVDELGSLEDVIEICRRTRGTEPVINWAHVHARGAGCLNSQHDFRAVIDKVKQQAGQSWLRDAFFLFSGMKYGPSGEIKHISFLDSDLKLEHLIRSVLSYDMRGTLIFEEPERERRLVQIIDRLGDMVR